MYKLVYLAKTILELGKTVMYDFWYENLQKSKIKIKINDVIKIKIVWIKTSNIYKEIIADVETRFATSNYDVNRPLPKVKCYKVLKRITKKGVIKKTV